MLPYLSEEPTHTLLSFGLTWLQLVRSPICISTCRPTPPFLLSAWSSSMKRHLFPLRSRTHPPQTLRLDDLAMRNRYVHSLDIPCHLRISFPVFFSLLLQVESVKSRRGLESAQIVDLGLWPVIEAGHGYTPKNDPPAHLRVTGQDVFRSKAIGNKRTIRTLESHDNNDVLNGKKQKTGEKQKDL
jgi:hypothetical protein